MIDSLLTSLIVLTGCILYGILARITYYVMPHAERFLDWIWTEDMFKTELHGYPHYTDKREYAWPAWLIMFIGFSSARLITLPFLFGYKFIIWPVTQGYKLIERLFTRKVKLPMAKVIVR